MLAAEGAGRGKGFACLGPIHAMEGGDRFTRRRGDAEGKGHLDGEPVRHRWVTRCRRRNICDRPLSLRSPRLRVRILLHGYGSALGHQQRDGFVAVATVDPEIRIQGEHDRVAVQFCQTHQAGIREGHGSVTIPTHQCA